MQISGKTKEHRLILSERKRARRMQKALALCRDVDRRTLLADIFANWALSTSSCCFASAEAEDAFLETARKIRTPEQIQPERGSCLILMTKAYAYGGHTRWVERWVSYDTGRKYSLATTAQSDIPETLATLIRERGGRLFQLTGEDLLQKGEQLRRLALPFESILAAPHMDDPVPIVAFGSPDFNRPVAFMNHANHLFWLGVSVADVILETGYWQKEFSERNRGSAVSRIVFLPHAVSLPEVATGRKRAREILGLPAERKIVLTGGSAYKYLPCDGRDFRDVIDGILSAAPDIEFYGIINAADKIPFLAKAGKRHGGRLHLLDRVSYREFLIWCNAADVLIDSIPFTGGGVMGDACECGCPCVTLAKTVINPFMPLVRCDSVEEVISRALVLLRNPVLAESLVSAGKAFLSQAFAKEPCQRKLVAFMDELAAMRHEVHRFTPRFSDLEENDVQLLATKYRKERNHDLFGSFVREAPFLYRRAAVSDFFGRLVGDTK